ncbi:PpiC-type peptidyl-prolyl cis-trans isomerase [Methylocella silvestris BL2]|uniref:Parvulin-like PPIase n=1 Tax=Methylocella silvestris (strain DSM 15510 / CIP 108128 / LMG 27833 / NCIMB 13906 / BL2) TaxID=395965 RepID=B8EHX4_METSB|nr:peptidylprolyl isomerase [Methylocella silvestris]ACK50456.1 PpiC-type peptidyl-prolyl cis-trans isomerase [Methylocella silvestris BL2]
MQIVTVNDMAIPAAAIAREAQNHEAESPDAAWEQAARALIIRELLLQRARALDLAAEPLVLDGAREADEEAMIRVLLEREVRTPTADESVCRRYYDNHRARFQTPDLFEPAHILFKVRRDDAAAYARAIERAEAVLAKLAERPDRFGDFARNLSDCPSGKEGGRLGQVALGDTTSEFETCLLAMEGGQICPTPVRARYGVHVLRLERKAPGQTLPFEAVRDRIAAYLEESSWRRAVAQYIALLAGQARVIGFDLPAATSPLVQ